jgi:HSP20 family protein
MAIELYRPNLPKAFDDMEDIVEHWMAGWPFSSALRHELTTGETWRPAVELIEKSDSYIVRAELPGVKKDDVDVSLSEGVLTLRGERKQTAETSDGEIHYREITYGDFERSFTLSKDVDSDKIAASYENGILEVTLPKAAVVQPKKIEVTIK